MKKGTVFVQGDFANAQTGKLFSTYGYEPVDSLLKADIVCWTGGSDINPAIYGERLAGCHGFSKKRDEEDLQAIKEAQGKFLVGICRGAQLLNCVPNGGTLWQDVNMHNGGNHSVRDLITGETGFVNSLHHQQMRPGPLAEVIAVSELSTAKYSDAGTWNKKSDPLDVDVEAVYYSGTRSLCLQWHPEFSIEGFSGQYFNRLLDRYYLAA